MAGRQGATAVLDTVKAVTGTSTEKNLGAPKSAGEAIVQTIQNDPVNSAAAESSGLQLGQWQPDPARPGTIVRSVIGQDTPLTNRSLTGRADNHDVYHSVSQPNTGIAENRSLTGERKGIPQIHALGAGGTGVTTSQAAGTQSRGPAGHSSSSRLSTAAGENAAKGTQVSVKAPAVNRSTNWSSAAAEMKTIQDLSNEIEVQSFAGGKPDADLVKEYNRLSEKYFIRPTTYTAENVGNYIDRAYYLSLKNKMTEAEKQEAKEILNVIEAKSPLTRLLTDKGDYYQNLYNTDRQEAWSLSMVAENLKNRLQEGNAVTAGVYGLTRGAGLGSMQDLIGANAEKRIKAGSTENTDLMMAQQSQGLQLGEAFTQKQHPAAYGAGNLAGNIIMLEGLGNAAGIAADAAVNGTGLARVLMNAGKVGETIANYLPGVLRSGMSFGANSAIQNAGRYAGGELSRGDYLAQIGISAGAGAAGSAAAQAAGTAMGKILQKPWKVIGSNELTGEAIRNTLADSAFARTVTAAATGAIFAGGDTAVRELSNRLRYGESYTPDVGEIIQGVLIAGAFGAIGGYRQFKQEAAYRQQNWSEGSAAATAIEEELARKYFPGAKNWEEAKGQFRKYAKEYHPDRFAEGSPERAEAERIMAEINRAGDWLKSLKVGATAAAGEEARARKAEAESRGDTKAAAKAERDMKNAIRLLNEYAADQDYAMLQAGDAKEALEVLNTLTTEEVPESESGIVPGGAEGSDQEGTPKKKGRTEEEKRESARKGFDQERRLVEDRGPEFQAWIQEKYNLIRDQLEALNVGDEIYGPDGDAVGQVIYKNEDGMSISYFDEDGEIWNNDRIPAGTLPSNPIILSFTDPETGRLYTSKGAAGETAARPALRPEMDAERAGTLQQVANHNAPIMQENKAEERRQTALRMLETGTDPVSMRELGVSMDGSGKPVQTSQGQNLTVLPEATWDPEMQLVNEWSRETTGRPVTYVQGNMFIIDGRGTKEIESGYSEEGVVLRADSDRRTVTQIFEEDILGGLQKGAGNETIIEGTAKTQYEQPGQEPVRPAAGEDGLRIGEADTVGAGAAAGTAPAVGTAGETAADGSGGRIPDRRAGGETGQLDGDAGAGSGRTDGEGRKTSGHGYGDALRERGEVAKSGREIGIERGTDNRTFYVIPDDMLTAELLDLRSRISLETGYSVELISGSIEVMGDDGRPYRANGFCDPVSRRIVIRADSTKYTAWMIAHHEEFHALAAIDDGLVEAVRNRVLERFGREEMNRIIRKYIEKRRGIHDMSNTSPDVLSEEAKAILEEIFADANGNMNAFGLGANRFAYDTWTAINGREPIRSQRQQESGKTRGPPQTENLEAERMRLQDLLTGLRNEGDGYTDPNGRFYTKEEADGILEQLADITERIEEREKPGSDQRFSYAGERSQTADMDALQRAKDMEEQDVDKETIRKETGWFRGMDGKWRYEIDDVASVYRRTGDARFRNDHPEYAEYQELMDRFLYGELSQQEADELSKLDRIWKNETGRLSGIVSRGGATLDMILDHEELFRAYPELRSVRVGFLPLSDGTYGEYSDRTRSIAINEKLRNQEDKARSTLLHEIQHAIQHIEGFTPGASQTYWAARNAEEQPELDARMNELQESAKDLRNELDHAKERAGYDDFVEESYAAAERGEIPWDEADARITDFENGNASIRSLNRALDDVYREMGEIRNRMRTADDLYRNTAGEIEARDVQERRTLGRFARQQFPPNLGDERTVFANGIETNADILRTIDNKPFVEVTTDILAGVPRSDWRKTVYNNLARKYPHGITIGRNQIVIDKQSRKELTWSKYTEWLRNNNPQVYADKLRATDFADEILEATIDWINEGLNHSRTDKISDFARGSALIRIGRNGYLADVVVGYENSGKMKLYDILNLTPTTIIAKETGTVNARDPSPGSSRRPATLSSIENIPHSVEESKQSFSISEEDNDQITFDEITGNEMYRSGLHPRIRERVESMESLTGDLKEYFGEVDPASEWKLGDEEIDSLADFDRYVSDPTRGDATGLDEVMLNLSALADEGHDREKTFALMERILPHLDAVTQEQWVSTDNEYEPLDEAFAAWYGERHPSLYYPGYQPGDLFDRGNADFWQAQENQEKEAAYLRELLDSGRLTEPELSQARDFLRRIENPEPNETFYSISEEDNEGLRPGAAEQTALPEDEKDRTIRELREANKELQKIADYWRKQGRITGEGEEKARLSDVQRITRELMEHADFQGERGSLQEKIQALGDMIVSNNGGSGLIWDDVRDAAREIAGELVDNSYSVMDTEKDTRDSLKSRLKELKIRPDPLWTGDFGDWDEFRRKQFGTLVFNANEGKSIDDVYQTLRGEFGDGLFPENVTAGSDQIYRILETVRSLEPKRLYNFSDNTDAEMAEEYYTNRITEELLFGRLGPERTQADRNYQRVKERLVKAEQEVREIRRESSRRVEELQRMQRFEIRAALENQRKGVREREEKQKLRKSISRTGKRLIKYLTENSGKNPIPEPLKDSIGKVLLDLDLSGGMEKNEKKRYIRNMQEVARIVMRQNAYMEGKTDQWAGMYLDLPTDIQEELDEHLQNVQKAMDEAEARGSVWNPNMMNAEELERLDRILTVLSSAVKNANALLSDARGAKVSEEAAKGIREIDSLGTDKNRSSRGIKVNNFLRFQNTTPVYFFKKLGQAGEEMFGRIQDGWDKFAFNAKKVLDFAGETYTAKEAKEIQDSVFEFKLRRRGDMSAGFDKTETVRMNKAQIMSLYCLWKRPQAQGHIAGAGIRIADFRDGRSAVTQPENYLLDQDDILEILSKLTPRDREIADALQKYMNTVGSDWGNEVSMKRFGIRSFTEENYFPIQTDDRSRPVRNPASETANLYRLLNMSFTKNTVRDASNSIVLDNIFDVFANHMADMAKYNGLGLPILDALKWFSYNQTSELSESGQYGYESVQKSVERAFGKEARNYFTTFMQDLNGVHEGGRGEELGSRMLSSYKVAAVGANLRVMMLQPTSYLRAGAILDRKYLAKGLTMDNRQGREEAEKWSGTAVWKSLGFYDTNINAGLREMIKHTDGLKEQVQEISMKGAEMGDRITWGALWNACKAEQEDLGLSGEELMEATAKRFREVVYQTQVMDSTMTRSHVMRQKGAYAGMMTAFMSEPTVSYNMLLDAYTRYENEYRKNMADKDPKDRKAQQEAREKAWKKTGGAVGKAAGAYFATAILSAIVESLIDAARDDDEYANYLERFSEKMLGFNPRDPDATLWENLKEIPNGNLMQDLLIHNKLPVVKDFFSILSGQGTSRMDTEWMANIVKAAQIAYESLALKAGWQEEPTKITYNGNMTGWGKIYNGLRAVSQLTGLPIGNAVRDGVALWNSTVGEMAPGMKIQTYDPGPEKQIQYAVKDGYLTEEEAVELLVQQELAEDENEARQKAYVWANPQKYERMLQAMNAGDKAEFLAAQEELEDLRFKQSSIGTAVSGEIEKRYLGQEDREPISREQAVSMLMEYGGMIERKAEALVREWSCELETGIPYSGIGDSFTAGDLSREQAEEMLVTYGGKNQEDAAAQVQKWSAGKETGIAYSEIGDRFYYGEISQEEAVDMYMKYGGKSREDAEDAANKIAFRKATGHERERIELQTMYTEGRYSRDEMKKMMLDYGYSKSEESAENSLIRWDFIGDDIENLDAVTPWQAKRYFEDLEDADIDKKTYLDFAEAAEQLKADYDDNGKAIAYSKMDKVLALIDSLDLSDEQKDALALAGWDSSNDGYSEKNLSRAPWHEGSTKKKTTKKKSGGGRRGGGGGRKGGGLILGEAFTMPENGRSGMYEQILKMWKRRKYSRAQILALVRTGKLTQEEADEILASSQDEEPVDGGLVLGAAEEMSA